MSTLNYAERLARASSKSLKGQAGRTSHWGGASIRVAIFAAIGLLAVGAAGSWLLSERKSGLETDLARNMGRSLTPVLTNEDRARIAVINHVIDGFAGVSEAEKRRIGEALFVEARRHGLDPLLLLAVASHESSFRKTAVSYAGARGIMQVMPATARAVASEMGVPYPGDHVLFDPEFSVKLGAYYLAKMRHHEPRLDMALTAYNMGLGRLREIRATRELNDSVYSRKVMDYYRGYQRKYMLAALGRPMDGAGIRVTAMNDPFETQEP